MTINGSADGLLPVQCQSITWTKETYCEMDTKEENSLKFLIKT